MSTIGNLPSADILVCLPSGTRKNVNMIRLLVQVQNAEFKAKFGEFLPTVGKLKPTVKALREEYEIPASVCQTWEQAAELLRMFHTDLSEQIANRRIAQTHNNPGESA